MNHLAAILASVAIASIWQGIALTLIAAALLRLMPRASASVRHTLLLAVFAASLLLPWLHLGHARAQSAASHTFAVSVAYAIASLWLLAAATRAAQLFIAWRHLRRVRSRAVPISVEALAAGPRSATLCTSPDVDSPMILGFFSPRLLLPEWMLPQLTSNELQQIALHECEHLRRHDDWLNLLLQLGLVLSPLNPALPWLNRRIGVQRELAVDAAVVAKTTQPLAYAACLTRLAEQRISRGHLRLALAAFERKSELAQRIHALLYTTTAWTPTRSLAAAASASALLLLASVGAARMPQLVQFTQASTAITTAAAPAATILPALRVADVTRAAVKARIAAEAQPHMVAAAFHTAVCPRKQNRKTRAVSKSTPLLKAQTTSSHLMLTSVSPTGSPAVEAVYSDAAPARTVPADFEMPYVAVPVPNGWLLIQL